jgi:hypothetical protein
MHSPGREPHYVEMHPDDLRKWTFHFLFALLNELGEEWTRLARSQRNTRAGQHSTEMIMKWWNGGEGAVIKMIFVTLRKIPVEV